MCQNCLKTIGQMGRLAKVSESNAARHLGGRGKGSRGEVERMKDESKTGEAGDAQVAKKTGNCWPHTGPPGTGARGEKMPLLMAIRRKRGRRKTERRGDRESGGRRPAEAGTPTKREH